MNIKKVYAVNSGSYIDYRVDAIFTTKKLAEEFMKAVPESEYNDIQEYELNPKTADLVKQGYAPWRVVMLRDGTTEDCERKEISTYNTADSCFIWQRTKADAYRGKNIPDAISCSVFAKSVKHAIKIVNEKRVMMIANGEWP